MKKVHIIWAIIAVIALIGGYFWGGAAAGTAKSAFGGASGSSTARRFAGTGAANGGMTLESGQISAMDSSSITLQLANGNSEVVFYSSSTEVTEPTVVPANKLAVGTNVMIGGTQNSDGSFTATSIQVRPAGAGYGGRDTAGTSGQ